ncbi:MAG TPA: carboxypeptidase regulatory-like domain-containing protein, partial [Gemmatimonadaceae bacterium]|nr:carboxypeptidase regulatory-like domain-containing protein [Gemmatimonadaceae bacterium]
MTTAFGQLARRRPRTTWIVAPALVLLASTSVRAQDTLAEAVPDVGTPVAPAAAARETPRRVFVGIVVGRVTDARTSAPIAGAAVEVEGTRLATSTGDDGRYRIPGVPAGSRVIVVRRLGYAASRQTVTVTD